MSLGAVKTGSKIKLEEGQCCLTGVQNLACPYRHIGDAEVRINL